MICFGDVTVEIYAQLCKTYSNDIQKKFLTMNFESRQNNNFHKTHNEE